MSLSDRFRSMLNKKSDVPAPPQIPSVASEPVPMKSPTLEDLGRLLAQERTEGETKQQALNKDLQGIRTSLEKLESTNKTSRETQNQTLQLLQQDAEREIKFFERKLREDMKHWDAQLKERAKALEQTARQGETGHLEKKATYEQSEASAREAAERAETLLKRHANKRQEKRP